MLKTANSYIYIYSSVSTVNLSMPLRFLHEKLLAVDCPCVVTSFSVYFSVAARPAKWNLLENNIFRGACTHPSSNRRFLLVRKTKRTSGESITLRMSQVLPLSCPTCTALGRLAHCSSIPHQVATGVAEDLGWLMHNSHP
jgi:hypothetical protein